MTSTSKAISTNICYYCKKAVGNCSWSEYDPKAKKLLFKPVPGWTAEPSFQKNGKKIIETYYITACPEFDPDDDYKFKCKNCGAEVTVASGRTAYCEKCVPSGERQNALSNAMWRKAKRRAACDDKCETVV